MIKSVNLLSKTKFADLYAAMQQATEGSPGFAPLLGARPQTTAYKRCNDLATEEDRKNTTAGNSGIRRLSTGVFEYREPAIPGAVPIWGTVSESTVTVPEDTDAA